MSTESAIPPPLYYHIHLLVVRGQENSLARCRDLTNQIDTQYLNHTLMHSGRILPNRVYSYLGESDE